MKMMNMPIEDLQKIKRGFPCVDGLISDDLLSEHIKKYSPSMNDELFTLGLALQSYKVGFIDIISPLENNLSLFMPNMNDQQKRSLQNSLLNGAVQFLNTLSELGIARYYKNNGWSVQMFCPLVPTGKDADMFLQRDGETRALDVINAAPQESEVDGSAPLEPPGTKFRLVDKIKLKYSKKFQEAINEGWKGSPWIAIDISKNDDLFVAVCTNNITLEKLEHLKEEIFHECPHLAGVSYFGYYTDRQEAFIIKEFRRQ